RSGFQNGLHGVGTISGFNAARDGYVGGIEAYYAGGMEAYNDARIQSAVAFRSVSGWSKLLPLEIRCALVEEGVHAFAKILAHIGLEDQILALVAGERAANAAHCLL